MKITTIGNGTTLPNGDIPIAQPQEAGHPVHLAASITAQTALERALLADPRLQAGLDWGEPRFATRKDASASTSPPCSPRSRATTRPAMTCGSSR